MAPFIAGILGTLLKNNLPTVAQAVLDKGVDYVGEKLGVELKPDMTPQEVAAVRERAMQHEEFLIKQGNDNTANARAMQIAALGQADVFSKRFVMYLATFWSVYVALYISFITFVPIPAENVRFADTVVGFLLGTIAATIVNYFFGSSLGSKTKDDDKERLLQQIKGG